MVGTRPSPGPRCSVLSLHVVMVDTPPAWVPDGPNLRLAEGSGGRTDDLEPVVDEARSQRGGRFTPLLHLRHSSTVLTSTYSSGVRASVLSDREDVPDPRGHRSGPVSEPQHENRPWISGVVGSGQGGPSCPECEVAGGTGTHPAWTSVVVRRYHCGPKQGFINRDSQRIDGRGTPRGFRFGGEVDTRRGLGPTGPRIRGGGRFWSWGS